jgi:hypothetical protein
MKTWLAEIRGTSFPKLRYNLYCSLGVGVFMNGSEDEAWEAKRDFGKARTLINTAINLLAYGRLDDRFRVDINGPGLAEAERIFSEALTVKREVGDRFNEMLSLHYLSLTAKVRGDDGAHSELWVQSKAIRDEIEEKLRAEGFDKYDEGISASDFFQSLK